MAAIGNFNGDRYADLGVSTRRDVAVLLGTETGIGLSGWIRLPVDSPSDLAVADVDADGLDDIIVASSAAAGGAQWTDSLVYYSDRGGFSTREPLRLPTLGASAVSEADLNGDRLPEIVFSSQNVTNQKNLLSYVYWNEGGRFRFERVTPGRYGLQIHRKPVSHRASPEFDVADGGTVAQDARHPPRRRLEGTVVDAAGIPVAGCRIDFGTPPGTWHRVWPRKRRVGCPD